jgi:hypothetical protein
MAAGSAAKLGGAEMEWQPIETAPRDGTSVLLYLPGTRIRVGCWRDRGSDGPGWGNPTESGERSAILGSPTHWMPLPKLHA